MDSWTIPRISIHLMLRFIVANMFDNRNLQTFQYISCYGLSRCFCYRFSCSNHFNTSHVTVYRKLFVAVKVWYPNFNTSHVTVYQIYRIPFPVLKDISIHLMLRFILEYYSTPTVLPTFQYISCYGLSEAIE